MRCVSGPPFFLLLSIVIAPGKPFPAQIFDQQIWRHGFTGLVGLLSQSVYTSVIPPPYYSVIGTIPLPPLCLQRSASSVLLLRKAGLLKVFAICNFSVRHRSHCLFPFLYDGALAMILHLINTRGTYSTNIRRGEDQNSMDLKDTNKLFLTTLSPPFTVYKCVCVCAHACVCMCVYLHVSTNTVTVCLSVFDIY